MNRRLAALAMAGIFALSLTGCSSNSAGEGEQEIVLPEPTKQSGGSIFGESILSAPENVTLYYAAGDGTFLFRGVTQPYWCSSTRRSVRAGGARAAGRFCAGAAQSSVAPMRTARDLGVEARVGRGNGQPLAWRPISASERAGASEACVCVHHQFAALAE